MRIILFSTLFVFAMFGSTVFSKAPEKKAAAHKDSEKEEHDSHEHKKGVAEEDDPHEHKEGEKDHHDEGEEAHAHGGEEGVHGAEEGNPGVGPEKGILTADEHTGIKLSLEATKTFELKTEKLTGSGPWRLPKAALVLAGEERNLYRFRDGFYKRVDFTSVQESSEGMTINSKDLKAGDEIVVKGLGFLRIAELAAFGGAPEGHSH